MEFTAEKVRCGGENTTRPMLLESEGGIRIASSHDVRLIICGGIGLKICLPTQQYKGNGLHLVRAETAESIARFKSSVAFQSQGPFVQITGQVWTKKPR